MDRKVFDYTQVGYSPEVQKAIEDRVKEVDKYVLMENVTYVDIVSLVKHRSVHDTARVLGVHFETPEQAIEALCNYYEARGGYDGDSLVYPMIEMMYAVERLTANALEKEVFKRMPKFDKEAIELAALSCLGSKAFLEELFEVLDGSDEYIIDSINSALDGIYLLAYENKWDILMDNTNKINSIIIRFFDGIRFDIDDDED